MHKNSPPLNIMFKDESEVGRKLIECKNVSDREGGAGNGAVGRSSRGRSSNPDNSSNTPCIIGEGVALISGNRENVSSYTQLHLQYITWK